MSSEKWSGVFADYRITNLGQSFFVATTDGVISKYNYLGSEYNLVQVFAGERDPDASALFNTGERFVFFKPGFEEQRMLVDDGKKIVTFSRGREGNGVSYRHRSLQGNEPVGLCYTNEPPPTCVVASGCGRVLAIGDAKGGITLLKTEDMHRLIPRNVEKNFKLPEVWRSKPITHMCFTRMDGMLNVIFDNAFLAEFFVNQFSQDVMRLQRFLPIEVSTTEGGLAGLSVIAPGSNGARLGLGYTNGKFRILNPAGGFNTVYGERYPSKIEALAFSRDDKVVLISYGNTLRLVDIETGFERIIDGFARPIKRIVPFMNDRYVLLDAGIPQKLPMGFHEDGRGASVLDFGVANFGRGVKPRVESKPHPFSRPFG